jgi:hypothetical protein
MQLRGHAARLGGSAPTLEGALAGQGRHQLLPAQHQALQVVRIEKGWCVLAHAGCPPARALLLLVLAILRQRGRRLLLLLLLLPRGRLQAAGLGALLLQGR